MADKTDIAHLLPILRRLCMEHQALKALLSESSENWKSDALRFQKAPKPRRDVEEQFREVSASL
jgi:hypothetical protein